MTNSREAYPFAPVIAIRKGRNAIHLSQQAGTWATAPLFVQTLCGRPITTVDGWVEVQEAATCQRCEKECAEIDAARAFLIDQDHAAALAEDEAYATDDIVANVTPLPDEFAIGERVGIVRGVQSVNGPHVYQYGDVVRTVAPWGTTEYVVRADDGSELVYPAYLLRPAAPEAQEASQPAREAQDDDQTLQWILDTSVSEILSLLHPTHCNCVPCREARATDSVPRELSESEFAELSAVLAASIYETCTDLGIAAPRDVQDRIADDAANALSRFGIRH